VDGPGPLFGVVGLAGSAWAALRDSDYDSPFQQTLSQATGSFTGMEVQWRRLTNQDFLEHKRNAEDYVRQFQGLPNEEATRLAELKAKLDAQLKRFLERYYIHHAKIKGIGNARKITLRSYGVETAADIARHRVESIPGFGPAMTGALVAWRTSLERKFTFDPTQPINPADILSVKAQIAKKRSDLEAAMRVLLTKLRQTSGQAIQSRNNIKAAAVPVWNALKQAELDDRAFKSQTISPTVRKWPSPPYSGPGLY
jgi:DNA-binding helix-hairpin-helix protein with protein kinase domain